MDNAAALEEEFCPPLDTAIVLAISSDYDLSERREFQQCRAVLQHLKEPASSEDAAGFDPSGTGGEEDPDSDDKHLRSCAETSTSIAKGIDISDLSNALSTLGADSTGTGDEGLADSESSSLNLERLDEETKIKLLQDLFGDRVSKYSIRYTLRKTEGRWQAAMEELLNHVYFDENGDPVTGAKLPSKSVDAFNETQILPKRKKKNKLKREINTSSEYRSSSVPSSPQAQPVAASNTWQKASRDISFVAERTGIAPSTVSSTYYANGASLSNTIGTLLKSWMKETRAVATDDDAVVNANTRQLVSEFPKISQEYLSALVQLTSPSLSSAHELASALCCESTTPDEGRLLLPQYAPICIDTDDNPRQSSKAQLTKPFHLPIDAAASSARVNEYSAAQSVAFQKAHAAHRKAKSDRLMGGAAAYYGQLGRDYSVLASQAKAASADRIAILHSTYNSVDLHGVDVLNAVRIAKDRVEMWWSSLGEARVNGRVGAPDRQTGYQIVVGRGTHSEGGKSKLRPAISKMLVTEGWKFHDEGVALVVSGKRRP